MKLATIGLDGRVPPVRRLSPEEQDRLLEALVGMNALLARATRI